MTTIRRLRKGADGESVTLERVHKACWLVHCDGNTQSPFEFCSEKEACEFSDFLFLQLIDEL